MAHDHSANQNVGSDLLNGSQDVGAWFAATYMDLRRLAEHAMRNENRGHTLRPTIIVHEAFLRMTRRKHPVDFKNVQHFRWFVMREMERVLIEYARSRRSRKRAPSGKRLPLSDLMDNSAAAPDDRRAVRNALQLLGQQDPVKVRLLVFHVLGGMTFKEIARALNMPLRTVYRKWAITRARLAVLLQDERRPELGGVDDR